MRVLSITETRERGLIESAGKQECFKQKRKGGRVNPWLHDSLAALAALLEKLCRFFDFKMLGPGRALPFASGPLQGHSSFNV